MSGWQRVKKNDAAGIALADRHYSRIAFGRQGGQLGPPGRLFCLRAGDQAIWVSHWPYAHLALDRLDAFRCSVFHNEGAGLSSAMILDAMALTQEHWPARPADEWLTWVAPGLVASVNPGFCFRQAGWWHDRQWKQNRPKNGVTLWRFRSHMLT